MTTSLDKQAREYFKSGGNGFESGGDEDERAFSCSFGYMVESAAAFASQVRKQSKWVSVATSGLPKRGQWCWVGLMAWCSIRPQNLTATLTRKTRMIAYGIGQTSMLMKLPLRLSRTGNTSRHHQRLQNRRSRREALPDVREAIN